MTADADESSLSSPERRNGKSGSAFRTIGEVVDELDVPQHVLRFWETKFSHIRPLKRAGGRRYYRPEDVALLRRIRDFLYNDGFTIKGVQKLLRENGAKAFLGETVNTTQIPLDLAGDSTGEEPELVETPGAKRLPQGDLESVLAELMQIRSDLSAALADDQSECLSV